MPKLAHVVGGVIADFPVAIDGLSLEDSYPPAMLTECVEAPDNAAVGWSYDGGAFAAPSIPAAAAFVPGAVSDRQFFQQLANDGDITEDEALAAVTVGTMPKKLTDAVSKLPDDEQFAAKMLICGATQFERSNRMVPLLGQALGKDSAALDAIWTAAAKL